MGFGQCQSHLIMDAALNATQQHFMSLDHFLSTPIANGFLPSLNQSKFSCWKAVEYQIEKPGPWDQAVFNFQFYFGCFFQLLSALVSSVKWGY